jgi:hypothetical protein
MRGSGDVPIGTYRIRPIKTWLGIRYVAERRGRFLFWGIWQSIDSWFRYERDAEEAIAYHRMPVPAPRIVP